MRVRADLCVTLSTLFLMTAPLLADSSALKKELNDPDPAAHWIYDDLPKPSSRPRRRQAADGGVAVYPLPPGQDPGRGGDAAGGGAGTA